MASDQQPTNHNRSVSFVWLYWIATTLLCLLLPFMYDYTATIMLVIFALLMINSASVVRGRRAQANGQAWQAAALQTIIIGVSFGAALISVVNFIRQFHGS